MADEGECRRDDSAVLEDVGKGGWGCSSDGLVPATVGEGEGWVEGVKTSLQNISLLRVWKIFYWRHFEGLYFVLW